MPGTQASSTRLPTRPARTRPPGGDQAITNLVYRSRQIWDETAWPVPNRLSAHQTTGIAFSCKGQRNTTLAGEARHATAWPERDLGQPGSRR
jgi:hypothetical protein